MGGFCDLRFGNIGQGDRVFFGNVILFLLLVVVLVRPSLPLEKLFRRAELLRGQGFYIVVCILVHDGIRCFFVESVVALFPFHILSPFRFKIWVENETDRRRPASGDEGKGKSAYRLKNDIRLKCI